MENIQQSEDQSLENIESRIHAADRLLEEQQLNGSFNIEDKIDYEQLIEQNPELMEELMNQAQAYTIEDSLK